VRSQDVAVKNRYGSTQPGTSFAVQFLVRKPCPVTGEELSVVLAGDASVYSHQASFKTGARAELWPAQRAARAPAGGGEAAQICPSGCVACSNRQWCIVCEAGLDLQDGRCLPCAPGCTGCQGGRCVGCSAGYWLNNFACVACTEHCATCALGGCTSCAPGFVPSRGACVAAASPPARPPPPSRPPSPPTLLSPPLAPNLLRGCDTSLSCIPTDALLRRAASAFPSAPGGRPYLSLVLQSTAADVLTTFHPDSFLRAAQFAGSATPCELLVEGSLLAAAVGAQGELSFVGEAVAGAGALMAALPLQANQFYFVGQYAIDAPGVATGTLPAMEIAAAFNPCIGAPRRGRAGAAHAALGCLALAAPHACSRSSQANTFSCPTD
jgi:hypothetical protein